MHTVYRVQDEKGLGPYSSMWAEDIHDMTKDFNERCPGPKARVRSNELFGFASIDQLKDWFNIFERERLHVKGFHVAIIETDEITQREKQITFDKYCFKVVKKVSIMDI